MRKFILIVVLLIGVLALAYFGYSKYQRGKFLPSAEFSMISSPQLDNVVSVCLALKSGTEIQEKYKRIIIENQTDYETLINEVKGDGRDFCQNVSFPQIDFSSKTLIGIEAAARCLAHFERDLRRDDKNKTYRYIVEEKLDCIPFIGCVARGCTYRHSLNLAVIPKLAPDYNLQFEFYEAKY